MIGPSDLNRIPRWTPARQSAELERYARLELGAENLGNRDEDQHAPGLHGIREWLASHVRLARPTTAESRPEPLRTGLAAVHFEGEAHRASQHDEALAETHGPRAVSATPAFVFAAPERHSCLDNPQTCEN